MITDVEVFSKVTLAPILFYYLVLLIAAMCSIRSQLQDDVFVPTHDPQRRGLGVRFSNVPGQFITASCAVAAFATDKTSILLKLRVSRRAIRSRRNADKIAKGTRVLLLKIISQTFSEVFGNMVLVTKVGSNLGSGDGERVATFSVTTN